MKLKTYIEKNDIDPKDGAAECGVSLGAFYHYINDKRVPTRAVMPRIYIWSGGLVCPNDFYDLPDLSSAAPRKAATLPPHITHAHFGGSGRI